MNLPVIVLQSGWRPSVIAASSARTAPLVTFDLQVDFRMVLPFRANCGDELPPKLVADYLGTADRGGRKFRVLNAAFTSSGDSLQSGSGSVSPR